MQQTNRLTPFFENINFEREDNTMVVNFGPQHPSAHGQLRLMLELQGEEVIKVEQIIISKIIYITNFKVYNMLWLTRVSSENKYLIALGENQRGEWNHDQKNTIFHI